VFRVVSTDLLPDYDKPWQQVVSSSTGSAVLTAAVPPPNDLPLVNDTQIGGPAVGSTCDRSHAGSAREN
jgi:hypothetical protein